MRRPWTTIVATMLVATLSALLASADTPQHPINPMHHFMQYGEHAQRHVEQALDELDPDHHEFKDHHASDSHEDQGARWFATADLNGDGVMDGYEMMASLIDEDPEPLADMLKRVDEIMEMDDLNKDGVISYLEFEESEAY